MNPYRERSWRDPYPACEFRLWGRICLAPAPWRTWYCGRDFSLCEEHSSEHIRTGRGYRGSYDIPWSWVVPLLDHHGSTEAA